MATELTWASDVNRVTASAANAANQNKWEAWYLLASLAGNTGLGFAANAGNWTVVRTCGSTDGTAGNLTADTTDRLHLGSSGAFTLNDWVFGANTTSGTGRSWALLQSPSALGSYYLILDFGNATGGKVDLIVGKTLSTNGTTTDRPTLTDEWVYTAAQISSNSVALQHRCHMHLSSRGDFWFYESIDAAGNFYSVFGVTKLQNAHSADLFPVMSVFVGANALNSNTGLQSASGASTSISGNGNTILKGRNYSGGSLPTTFCVVIPCAVISNALASVLAATNATGSNTSDATYNAFGMWVLDTAGPELKGRIADCYWASGGAAQGSVISSAAPFVGVKTGHAWMPWVTSSAPAL